MTPLELAERIERASEKTAPAPSDALLLVENAELLAAALRLAETCEYDQGEWFDNAAFNAFRAAREEASRG